MSLRICLAPLLGIVISQSGCGGGEATQSDAAIADAQPDAAPVATIDTNLEDRPAYSTSSTTAGFTFSATEEASRFECGLDAGNFVVCNSPYELTDLSEGHHVLLVRAIDLAGLPDLSPASASWEVDVTPPETTVDSGPTGVINVSTADFEFSSDELDSFFECSLNAGAFASCTSPHSLSDLGDGSNSFEVRALDGAGNIDATPASQAFAVVTGGAPDTTITSSPALQSNDSSGDFSFSSTKVESTFECRLDTGSFESCTSPHSTVVLAEGEHTFAVRATDLGAMTDQTPASFTWTVDTQAPDTTITQEPPATTTSTSATFSFTTEASGTFECRLDAANFAACASPRSYTGLSHASHTFDVRAMDVAGNVDQSPASVTWTVQTCIADADCGNCGSCGSGICSANASACTGDCDTCSGSGTNFNCASDNGLCTGFCEDCSGSGTSFNCGLNATLCSTSECDPVAQTDCEVSEKCAYHFTLGLFACVADGTEAEGANCGGSPVDDCQAGLHCTSGSCTELCTTAPNSCSSGSCLGGPLPPSDLEDVIGVCVIVPDAGV